MNISSARLISRYQQDVSLKKDRYYNKRRAFMNTKALPGNDFKSICKWDNGE